MKAPRILVPFAAAALLVWITGCEKKDASVQDQAKSMTDEASAAVKKDTAAVPETATKAVSHVAEPAKQVVEPAKEIAAPARPTAQELIVSARSLVSEGKYQDTLGKLKELELSGEKLAPDQQSVVNAIKAQIQNALGATTPAAADSANAAAFPPKK